MIRRRRLGAVFRIFIELRLKISDATSQLHDQGPEFYVFIATKISISKSIC